MTDVWMPIETAPKDGSRFLCYEEDGNVSTAFWDKEKRLGGRGWSYAEWLFPTHWRPMPKTPEQESKILHFDLTKPEEMDAAISLFVGLLERPE